MRPENTFFYKVTPFPYRLTNSFGLVFILILGLWIFSCARNEYAPEVSDQEFSIDENSPSGTIIGVVTASDLDEYTILEYSILEGNPNSTFIIGENTGILSVGNPTSLDYEENNSFSLKIQVSDNQEDDSKFSDATIKININDLNEYAPVIEDHVFQIEEFPGNDSLIGKINATDQDMEQSLIFSIESGNENHSIVIDSLTGEVFVADSSQFDLDINQSIKCMLSVSDNHPTQPKKAFAMLTIEILEGRLSMFNISGTAQKGPFIQGSTITVSELNEQMELTGRTFTTNISDNSGSFLLEGISLESKYVQLSANGFYFNERTGNLTNAQMPLYCIADITNLSYININILTHLEIDRMKYLINGGMSFNEAKAQAHQEVLDIFNFSNDGYLPEQMDISKPGDDNAILLAASLILQGNNSAAELAELLNGIITDIKEDGVLDNQNLGTELINSVNHANLAAFRNALDNRYSGLNSSYTIPDFEKFVNHFIENTDFIPSNEIVFPVEGKYGNNALHLDTTYVIATVAGVVNHDYSLCVDVPAGRSFKAKLKGTIYFSSFSIINYEIDNASEEFTISSTSEGRCDLRVSFRKNVYDNPDGEIVIEYYSDDNTEPYFTKNVTIIGLDDEIPNDSTNMR